MGHKIFSEIVKKSWSESVAIASHNIDHYRPQLIEGLKSDDPSVRSAAVASFNEGNDASAHDDIISLIDDPDEWVRHEVAEYLQDFAVASDAKLILEKMELYPSLLFLLSTSLQRITGRENGLINEEDSQKQIKGEISKWRSYLAEKGLLKKNL